MGEVKRIVHFILFCYSLRSNNNIAIDVVRPLAGRLSAILSDVIGIMISHSLLERLLMLR